MVSTVSKMKTKTQQMVFEAFITWGFYCSPANEVTEATVHQGAIPQVSDVSDGAVDDALRTCYTWHCKKCWLFCIAFAHSRRHNTHNTHNTVSSTFCPFLHDLFVAAFFCAKSCDGLC